MLANLHEELDFYPHPNLPPQGKGFSLPNGGELERGQRMDSYRTNFIQSLYKIVAWGDRIDALDVVIVVSSTSDRWAAMFQPEFCPTTQTRAVRTAGCS